MVTTVTRDGWSVSTLTGASPYARLNVVKHLDPAGRRLQRGDHDGRLFLSSDDASAFALERGYLQPFAPLRGGRMLRPLNRRFLRQLQKQMLADLAQASTGPELVALADQFRAAVSALPGGGPLVGLRWANGFWSAVHALRPDILARAAAQASQPEPVA